MKHIIIILLSIVSVTVYSQSPRIKLNQIVKDNAVGSILISSPTDSQMVYSRDFFINFGTDTTLVLFGDTIGSGISTVVTDLVTIQGDGSVATPLYVDTSIINTIQGMIDTLTARGYLTTEVDGSTTNEIQTLSKVGQTVSLSLSGGSFTDDVLTESEVDAFVANNGYLTAEVDGSITNEGSLTVQAGGSNDSQIQSNTSGSSNVTIAGGSNVTVTESGNTITIASTASGGGSIPVDTFVTIAGTETISGAKTFTSDLNVDAKIALNAGDNNIVIGDGAGASLVSGQGFQNVLIGTSAGAAIDSGDYNVVNGNQALFLTTKGSYNIANGYQALFYNTSGTGNQANGVQSLRSNKTGNYNIANGYLALYNNESGSHNQANGYIALYNNISGSYNIANGWLSLYSLSSGSDNQAYGYRAGRYLSDGSTALTTANGSLFIGSSTRASANGNSNEIVIGTSAIGNGSNTITIGSSSAQSLHTRNYEFDIDQTVSATEDNYVLTYDNADGQISLEPATGGTATIPVDTFVTIAGTETITGAKTFTSDIVVQNEESNTNAAELNLYKKNGSSSGEVTVNDNIGNINFKAENGATTVTSASIEVDATTLYNNQIGGDILFKTASNFHSRPLTEAMRIDKLGYVGINTSSPSENLDVNGNGRFRSIGSGASAGALHYTSTGVLTTNTSDARLKTNLQPLENTLNKLLNINTYTFNWINETNRVDLGMVAQEVEQIFPNLVFTNSVDGYKGIHYDKFSSILTKAIQEQQAIIETQQQKITNLESTIQSLITRIETLENQ